MSGNAPVFIRHDFLDEATADGLLDYALAHREAFQSTRIGIKDRAREDPQNRISVASRDLGPFRPLLNDMVAAGVPEMLTALAMTPISIAKIELEVVAHGDGAFYSRHIDLNPHRQAATIRALSGVYYFHARPRAFSGGALRLYPSATGATDKFINVDPAHNSLAVFPSWVVHEVMPVRCPSNRFEDSRFSVNCWVHVLRKPG
ncbi:MAG: 2OG-Fe(II) oxygenase [Sphingomonas sp.]|jgi:Rps23 Pro-64 3,4-dihydroxylase Tpa1-like proline 4-hydroxylase|uniref:2OG-Fe(II) oxygenase n=1 Tax=Sphingomonas sp. TaxID=28214 RepID=UPI00356B316C